MKVVINRCFGGFRLSNEAIERCIELGMTVSESWDDDTDFVRTKDNDSFTRVFNIKYWTSKERSKEFRSNPIVIQAVEELGEKANGYVSKLKIINIPFDTLEGWEITKYDGMESIEESHESWS